MTSTQVKLPPKLIPVFTGPADVRGSYGGRGSGKTRSFAKMAAVFGYRYGMEGITGIILCARQFMNSLDDSSLEEVKRAIEEEPFLAAYYEIGEKYIKSRDGRISFAFAGLDRNIASVKSKGRILLCWVDEAEPVTESAFSILVPTLREEGDGWNAELWVTWNPMRKNAAVETRYRTSKDPLVKIVSLNWRDNPRFPEKLERERQRDLRDRPEDYDHIWEGAYKTVAVGAYYAKSLTLVRLQRRIGFVAPDPLMTYRVFCDIGGTGAKADSFTMWVAQFVGREIRILDYYEAVGQPFATHLGWLRERGYSPAYAQVWLPHDGSTQDKVFDVSFESAFRAAGYAVTVVPNQGKGAAKQRIEAARRLFPAMWFNEATTEGGVQALGWYHEKRDEARNIGLGPDHDWSSHACFVGETKALTRYGMCQIKDLPNIGEVLTPCGWKQYINPRVTKLGAQLVEVVFKGGYSVKCTPDHLFLTVSGWKSAQSLTRGLEIQSSSTRSPSISEVGSTACGHLSATSPKGGVGSTEMCGKRLLGLFRKGVTSIIGMVTSSIINWKTWNAWKLGSTSGAHGNNMGQNANSISPRMLVRKPQNGTNPLKVESGTDKMLSKLKAGQNGNVNHGTAQNVESNSRRLSGKAVMPRFIAALRAKLRRTGNVGSKTSMPLLIERVRPLNERADVWDITVPDGHWFCLENGAVVHNSDSFGLMCVVYELPENPGTSSADWRKKQDKGGSWRSR